MFFAVFSGRGGEIQARPGHPEERPEGSRGWRSAWRDDTPGAPVLVPASGRDARNARLTEVSGTLPGCVSRARWTGGVATLHPRLSSGSPSGCCARSSRPCLYSTENSEEPSGLSPQRVSLSALRSGWLCVLCGHSTAVFRLKTAKNQKSSDPCCGRTAAGKNPSSASVFLMSARPHPATLSSFHPAADHFPATMSCFRMAADPFPSAANDFLPATDHFPREIAPGSPDKTRRRAE